MLPGGFPCRLHPFVEDTWRLQDDAGRVVQELQVVHWKNRAAVLYARGRSACGLCECESLSHLYVKQCSCVAAGLCSDVTFLTLPESWGWSYACLLTLLMQLHLRYLN